MSKKLKTKIDFKQTTPESFDGAKVNRLICDEYGQMCNIGLIQKDTWKHTDLKITKLKKKNK